MQRPLELSLDSGSTLDFPPDAQRVHSDFESAPLNCSKSSRMPGQNGHSVDLTASHPAHSVLSRRKRVRISPLSRTVTPQPKECSQHIPEVSTDAKVDFCASENPSTAQSIPHLLSQMNLVRIDPDVRDVIRKYVPSDSIVRCLELAGFTSPHVLACLDESQVQRLEDFVGHACMLMDSINLRESFTGPIFAQFPEHFRLPSGAICGLLLAAGEIKSRLIRIHASTSPDSVTPTTSGRIDASSQTEISIPSASSTNPFLMLSSVYGLPALHNGSSVTPSSFSQPMVTSLSNSIGMTHCTEQRVKQMNTGSLNSTLPLDASVPTSDTVAIMAAAFQAAAFAASNNDYSLQQTADSSIHVSTHTGGSDVHSTSNEFAQTFAPSFSADPNSSTQQSVRLVATVSGRSVPACVPSNSPNSGSSMTHYDEEIVDLDRLKQHSSASATRLASRQFLNAHLIRGRDFDMEMEISTTPEGVKRVTGIFYCHLCREKRERTSAVRFSIARNRYPVLSNVLSHLKTHFQYRGQLFTGSQFFHTTNNLSKLSSGINDNTIPVVGHSNSGSPYTATPTLGALSRNATHYFDPHVSSALSPCISANTVARCDVNQPTFDIKSEVSDAKTNTTNDDCTTSPGRVRRVCTLQQHSSPNTQSQGSSIPADASSTESPDYATFGSALDHCSCQSDSSTR